MKKADPVVELLGDLVFDYLEFLLGGPASAMVALKRWLESLRKHPLAVSAGASENDPELRYQALRRASEIARPMYAKLFHDGRPGPSPTPLLASLAQLRFEERAAVLLRDRLGLEIPEIARILLVPEDNVRLARGKALQTLAEMPR